MSLDELANFLNSSSAPQGCMDLSELDGFLAGLVAGPEIVPREEWLAEVWDNEEPDYLDEAEQESVEQAIFDRYAAIESGLECHAAGLRRDPVAGRSRHHGGRGLGGWIYAGCQPSGEGLATGVGG